MNIRIGVLLVPLLGPLLLLAVWLAWWSPKSRPVSYTHLRAHETP